VIFKYILYIGPISVKFDLKLPLQHSEKLPQDLNLFMLYFSTGCLYAEFRWLRSFRSPDVSDSGSIIRVKEGFRDGELL